MEQYLNLSGNSPVTHYQINDDNITVWFKGNPKAYIYPEYLTGSHHLTQLKSNAQRGKGLSAYITKNVRDKFI